MSSFADFDKSGKGNSKRCRLLQILTKVGRGIPRDVVCRFLTKVEREFQEMSSFADFDKSGKGNSKRCRLLQILTKVGRLTKSNLRATRSFGIMSFSERWRVGHEDREKSGREVVFKAGLCASPGNGLSASIRDLNDCSRTSNMSCKTIIRSHIYRINH
ncbi:hypothetical protein OUZ56_014236 [Daphnia magna]|uniref:Uncharacterized protein n=1 Tax=Daphnia magna TaxID=35525 RepID=A0ABQ9Z8V2_9CRUS|nr:hypothetical protein OUZ56_014236 [Daphnia magna]